MRTVYEVPADRQYWVVRAEGGHYYDHFIKHGIIALGHIDELKVPDVSESAFSPDVAQLTKSITELHKTSNINRHRSSTHIHQVLDFIYEMKVGDWVLTIGTNRVHFGRVVGTPRLDSKPLPIFYGKKHDRRVDLQYRLRRSVVWGPSISRHQLPYGLQRSFKANQTIFSLRHNWEAIYHSLYPYFMRGNDLYFSARINTSDKVKNHSVSSLLKLMDEIEVISKELDNGLTEENFEAIFRAYLENNQLTTTTKAQFQSPGEIWNVMSFAGDVMSAGGAIIDTVKEHWAVTTVTLYSMLFGNKKLGFDGLIDVKTRQLMWKMILSRIENNYAQKTIKNLELKAPEHDTKKLESSEADETDETVRKEPYL